MSNLIPQRKLVEINERLGNNSIRKMQATAREIYDTVTAAAGVLSYDFFRDFGGKTIFQTNLDRNRLNAGESMTINHVLVVDESPTPAVASMLEGAALLNITIGNQVILKDFNLTLCAIDGLQPYPVIGTTSDNKIASIPLLTSVVIPPDVTIKASVRFNQAIAASPIKLVLKGYGTLFAPSTSL